ncbi:protein of unknown function [Ruminococcaceae bacterium BL-4]|jgi:hypothetical protein|nr:protein of unknown function [Ruminococcaceae bacterium BL-4]
MNSGIIFKDKQYEKTLTANINRLATQLDRYLDSITKDLYDLSDAEAESIPGVAKLLYELYQWGAEVSHDSQD